MSAVVVQQLVALLGDETIDADLRTALFIAEDASMSEKLAATCEYTGLNPDELAEAGAIVPLSDFPV